MKLNASLQLGLMATTALLLSQMAFHNVGQKGEGSQLVLENYIYAGKIPNTLDYVFGVENKTTGQLCGGYRLASKLILTSAQCVANRSSDSAIKIRVGLNISQNYAEVSVKSVYQSANYIDPTGKKLDEFINGTNLAVLILEDEIDKDSPPQLDLLNDSVEFELAMGVLVGGYGQNKINDPTSFGELRFAGMAIMRILGTVFMVQGAATQNGDTAEIEAYNKRYGMQGGGVCSGDEGAPAFFNDRDHKKIYLAGIVSRVIGSKTPCRGAVVTGAPVIRSFLNEFKSKNAKLLKSEGIELKF